MPSIDDYSLPPPKHWQKLEDLIWELYKEIWKDPDAQKVGTYGQSHNGVDIVGHPDRGIETAGVQVKRRETRLTVKDLEQAVEEAQGFTPMLDRFTIVTSARNDSRIQRRAHEIHRTHQAEKLFSVTVLGWDEIERRLYDYSRLVRKYYPGMLPSEQSVVDEETALPVFAKAQGGGLTCTETAFTPQWKIRHVSGDKVAELQWRFRGPRFHMDWRYASCDAMDRTAIINTFDLSLPPQQDEDGRVGVDEIGLEIRFHWRGRWRRELRKWSIRRTVFSPTKIHWDVGDEVLPPYRWDE